MIFEVTTFGLKLTYILPATISNQLTTSVSQNLTTLFSQKPHHFHKEIKNHTNLAYSPKFKNLIKTQNETKKKNTFSAQQADTKAPTMPHLGCLHFAAKKDEKGDK